MRRNSILFGIFISIVSFSVYAIPTAIVANPFFTRMTPITIFDKIFVILIPLLIGIYCGIVYHRKKSMKSSKYCTYSGGVLAILALACPICNSFLVWLFGATFLLNYFEPLRPLFGIVTLILLLSGIYIETKHFWRKIGYTYKFFYLILLI